MISKSVGESVNDTVRRYYWRILEGIKEIILISHESFQDLAGSNLNFNKIDIFRPNSDYHPTYFANYFILKYCTQHFGNNENLMIKL